MASATRVEGSDIFSGNLLVNMIKSIAYDKKINMIKSMILFWAGSSRRSHPWYASHYIHTGY
jgi:hypothetical protein